MDFGIAFMDLIRKIFYSINLFFLGKKVQENEVLHKQNKKMQKQMELAVSPALSWDKLLEWLRTQ